MLKDRTGRATTLSEADGLTARRAVKALSRVEATTMPDYLHFSELPDDVVIPKAAMPLIAQILDAMGEGKNVRVMAENSELTPQQAAEMLGVSRPFFVHLLDSQAIPYRYVGSHRRILLSEILAYRTEKERQRAILDILVQEAQELGMGY